MTHTLERISMTQPQPRPTERAFSFSYAAAYMGSIDAHLAELADIVARREFLDAKLQEWMHRYRRHLQRLRIRVLADDETLTVADFEMIHRGLIQRRRAVL